MAASLGGGGGLRGHGELPLEAGINVTSLVDVAFVLLIIFMITAPMMQGGIEVQLPRTEGRPLQPKEGLVITVDRGGRVFLDETPLRISEFGTAFRGIVERRRPSGVYINADARASWESVARVLAIIQTSGVSNVGIVTEPVEVNR